MDCPADFREMLQGRRGSLKGVQLTFKQALSSNLKASWLIFGHSKSYAISMTCGKAALTDCIVERMVDTTYAVRLYSTPYWAQFTATRTTFGDNTLTYGVLWWINSAGVYAHSGPAATLNQCTFADNFGGSYGSAISAKGTAIAGIVYGTVTLNGCSITGSSNSGGSAVYATKGGKITLSGGSVTGNTCAAGYGALHAVSGGKVRTRAPPSRAPVAHWLL